MHRRRRPSAAFFRSLHAAEMLEPRRLLATLSGGVLSIDGTSGSERFTIDLDGTDLVVSRNGAAGERFARSSVTRIDAALGNGDDSIEIDFAVDVPASLNGEAGNDTLVGGAGNDTLDGGSGNDSLDGGAGDDAVTYASRGTPITATVTLGDNSEYVPSVDAYLDEASTRGSGGASGEADGYARIESIVGGSGPDRFTLIESARLFDPSNPVFLHALGGSGNDTFAIAGQSDDSVDGHLIADGQSGDDTFSYASDAGTLIGGDGDDTFVKNINDDTFATLVPGDGDDLWEYQGGSASDVTMPAGLERIIVAVSSSIVITGNDEANQITVGSPGGTVKGGGGDDTVFVDRDDATIDGGSGNDTVSFANVTNPESVTGTLAARFTDSATTITGTASFGVDSSSTRKYSFATSNVENLVGSAADDTLSLSIRDDRTGVPDDRGPLSIDGGAGDDTLRVGDGSTGAATLLGGDGDDTLSAGEGNDVVYGGAGDDSIHGDAGNDTLYGQDGRDKIWGRAGDDRIDGGNSNDVLRGEDGDDKVYGRDGNDSVSGGEGRDSVYGDAGNDTLNGDGGRDICYGGAGTDTGAKQSIDRIFKQIELLA